MNQTDSTFLIHPATMNTGLQALFAAFQGAGDGRLSTLYIPIGIECTTINPKACDPVDVVGNDGVDDDSFTFEAAIARYNCDGFFGDVDIFKKGGNGAIQFEGVQVSPLVPQTQENDQLLFSTINWGPLFPDANWRDPGPSPEWCEKADLTDHIAFLYIKEVSEQLTKADSQQFNWHRLRVVERIDRVLSITRSGQHPVCMKEWMDETIEEVPLLLSKLGGVDAIMLQSVGESLLSFLQGELSLLKLFRQDDILGRFYREEIEINKMNEHVGNLAGQIAFRFPRTKILEIGAGTGSATRAVLNRIGRAYHSYTFTDISAGFFEEAESAFAEHDDRFVYQALDIGQDPKTQGFEEHEYDLVIAANALHATKSLEQAMRRIRRLLKPGGRLIALEGTNTDIIRVTFSVCALEGWWLGEEDYRHWSALIQQSDWEALLKQTGFGGIETITTLNNPRLDAYSAFVAQAEDDQIWRQCNPLAGSSVPTTGDKIANGTTETEDLIIIGKPGEWMSPLLAPLEKSLAPQFHRGMCAPTFEHMDSLGEPLASSPVILIFEEASDPCFPGLTETRLRVLKELVNKAQKMLWVAVGSEARHPSLSMGRGFLHASRYERPNCLFQHLNVVDPSSMTTLVAATLMRLVHAKFPNDYMLSKWVESIEPDLRFEDGMMETARIQTENSKNRRHNASRRAITTHVDLGHSVVRVEQDTHGLRWTLVDGGPRIQTDSKQIQGSGCVQVTVAFSTLSALKVGGAGFLHLVIGRNTQTNARVLALSDRQASIISTPACYCLEIPDVEATRHDESMLQATASAIMALSVLDLTIPGSALLVYEGDKVLQQAIRVQADTKGVRPFFIKGKPNALQVDSGLFIHPH